MATESAAIEAARLALLRRLAEREYRFTTPAPSSHHRILLRRRYARAACLEDIFGWNLPFRADEGFADWIEPMQSADVLRRRGALLYSGLRVASVGRLLFLHDAFPPRARDAVFFGPDSYRFVNFIQARQPPLPPGAVIVDIGAGSGVGGIFAHSRARSAQLVLADVNPAALELGRVNAAFACQSPRFVLDQGLPATVGQADLVLANPPYLGGGPGQTYSDGGGVLGGGLSIDWTRQALARLRAGGRFLLYTGAAFVRGQDQLRPALHGLADEAGCRFEYEELDADVFPSTLLRRAYWGVERIAAVGAVMTKPG